MITPYYYSEDISNFQKMTYSSIKILLFHFFFILLISHHSIAQNRPPVLKNGQALGSYLLLGYRAPVDSFTVIIVKFRLSVGGFLDTLYISNNAPAAFVKSTREQLSKLDGEWKPQFINGKPAKSKWLISRYYVRGFRESIDSCIKRREEELFDAYKREEELFSCTHKEGAPRKCMIDYIEGYDYYLYPPMLIFTVR